MLVMEIMDVRATYTLEDGWQCPENKRLERRLNEWLRVPGTGFGLLNPERRLAELVMWYLPHSRVLEMPPDDPDSVIYDSVL